MADPDWLSNVRQVLGTSQDILVGLAGHNFVLFFVNFLDIKQD